MANVTISRKNIIVESSLTLDPTQLFPVEQALVLAQDYLQNFARKPDFRDRLSIVFGEGANFDLLGTEWLSGDFSIFPEIEIIHAADIHGANGAFASATNKIYLSQEFITNHQGDVGAITRVLLEEIGHSVDAKVNRQDTLGDEGELFSNVVRGIDLSESQLGNIQQEDDSALVNIDSQEVLIEQAVSLDSLKSSLGQLSNVLGGVKATLQDSIFKTIPIIGDIGKNISDSNSKVGQLIRTISDLQAVFQDIQSASFGNVDELVTSLNQKADEKLSRLDKDVINFAKEPEVGNSVNLKLNFNQNLDLGEFDIDPTLGLLKSVGFDGFNGTVKPTLDFKLNELKFGVNSGGSAFVNKDSSKLFLDIRLNNNPELKLKGNLFGGVLGVTLTPAPNLGFGFEVGLTDPNNYKFKSPTTLFEFNIKADPGNNLPAFIPNIPEIKGLIKLDEGKGFSLSDISVNTTSLKNSFIGKVGEAVKQVIKPLDPILELLGKPVPLLNDLYGVTAFKPALINIAKNDEFTDEEIKNPLNVPKNVSFLDVITFVAKTQDIDFDPLPILRITETVKKLTDLTFQDSVLIGSLSIDNKGEKVKNVKEGTLTTGATSQIIGLNIPLFEDPSNTILDLLLGKTVDLVTYKLPDFELKGAMSQVIPIIVPLGVSVGGAFDIRTQLGFGFDTFGLLKDAKNIGEGFYLTDLVNGKDVPEINLGAGPTFGPGLTFGAASVDVNAGITINLRIDLANRLDIDRDSKFRLSEIDNFKEPISIFDYKVGVGGNLGGSIKVAGANIFSERIDTPIAELGVISGDKVQKALDKITAEFEQPAKDAIAAIQKVLKIIKDPVGLLKDGLDALGDFAGDVKDAALEALSNLDFTNPNSPISKALREFDPTNPSGKVGKLVNGAIEDLDDLIKSVNIDPRNIKFSDFDPTNPNSKFVTKFNPLVNIFDNLASEFKFDSQDRANVLNELKNEFNDIAKSAKNLLIKLPLTLIPDLPKLPELSKSELAQAALDPTFVARRAKEYADKVAKNLQKQIKEIGDISKDVKEISTSLTKASRILIDKIQGDEFKELIKDDRLDKGITLEGDTKDNVLVSSNGLDTLKGLDGNDKLSSGDGSDIWEHPSLADIPVVGRM